MCIIICPDTCADLQEDSHSRERRNGSASRPERGCHPKAEGSQAQSLGKPNHNPEKCTKASLFTKTPLAESVLTAQMSSRKQCRELRGMATHSCRRGPSAGCSRCCCPRPAWLARGKACFTEPSSLLSKTTPEQERAIHPLAGTHVLTLTYSCRWST